MPTDTLFRRPMRIDLRPDDVLFFHHIPKTGGLSLISYLDQHYTFPEIFPKHSEPDGPPFEEVSKLNANPYRIVRGHHSYGPYDEAIYRYVARNPIWITFLREPVARTISAYHHRIRQERLSGDVSLEEYVTNPEYHSRVKDRQTHMIAGQVKRGGGMFDLSDEVMLHLAKENLEQMAFFGLIERYRESLQMLAYVFGWRPPEDMPLINVSPKPTRVDEYPPELIAKIEAVTQLDAELYRFAQGLFTERYQQMVDEMVEANYEALHNSRATTGTLSHTINRQLHATNHHLKHLPRSIRRVIFPQGTKRAEAYFKVRDRIKPRKQPQTTVIRPASERRAERAKKKQQNETKQD